jgi:hypothetical protein
MITTTTTTTDRVTNTLPVDDKGRLVPHPLASCPRDTNLGESRERGA